MCVASPPGTASASVERVEERLALHEVLRVGLARQEDLQLLQQLAQELLPLPAPALVQAFKECRYREEWRCIREQQLLSLISSISLSSPAGSSALAGSPAGTALMSSLLTQQLDQVKQMQAQQRSTRLAGTLRRPAARPSASPHHAPSVHAALSLYAPSAGATPASTSPDAPPGHTAGPKPGLVGAAPSRAAALPAPGTPPRGALSGGRPGGNGDGGGTPLVGHPPRGVVRPMLVRAHSGSASQPSTPPSSAQGLARQASGSPARAAPGPHGKAGGAGGLPALLTADELRRRLDACKATAGGGGAPAAAGVLATIAGSTPTGAGVIGGGQRTTRSAEEASTAGPAAALGVRGAGASQAGDAGGPVAAALPMRPTSMARQGQPRFQRLLKLHGVLLNGLQQHSQAGGVEAALAALQESVAQMQQHFGKCLAEASRMRGVAAAVLPPGSGSGGDTADSAGCGSSGGPSRANHWSRQLMLGQLGLTPADTARLQVLCRQAAARVLQRGVRAWLRRRRAEHALRGAAEQAARAQAWLQEHAVLILQRHWRAHAARRLFALMAAEARQRVQRAAAERVRAHCAASRVQRAWRAHRRRRRAALALAHGQSSQPGGAQPPAALDMQGGGMEAAGKVAGHGGLVRPAVQTAAAATTSGTGGHGGKPQLGHRAEDCTAVQHERAAARIQAAVRGWLCRRSEGLWWMRQLVGIRSKRAEHGAWAAHCAYLQKALPLQQQLVDNLCGEARAQRLLQLDAERESKEFEARWLGWLAAQHAAALSQPLPRGWVPHTDTASGQDMFLDTRTGVLHAHHPAVMQLRSFAAAQREQAVAALQRHLAATAERTHVLQAAAAGERQALLRGLHGLLATELLALGERQGRVAPGAAAQGAGGGGSRGQALAQGDYG